MQVAVERPKTADVTTHQVIQSILQFLAVLVAELVGEPMPTTIEEWWQPVLKSLGATLAIYGFSKVKVARNRR